MAAEVILAQALRDTKLTAAFRKGLDHDQVAELSEAICRQAKQRLRDEAEFFAVLYLNKSEGSRSLDCHDEISRVAGVDLAAHARRFFGRLKNYLREAITAAAMGLAGNRPLTGEELGDIDRHSAVQEAYLGRFMEEFIGAPPALRPEKSTEIIAIAPPMTVAQFIARAESYGNSPWAAGYEIHRSQVAREGIMTRERRVLGAVDERNCSECPELASLGFQPLGVLPPLGSTTCNGNCRCHWEYSSASTSTA